ncbi:hypothetical protein ACFL4H_01735 [Candidatus Neomarinimicrobiota bacterium]
MNKTTIRVIISLLVIILLIPCLGFTQDKEKPNIVLAVTYIHEHKEGSTVADLDSIWALWDKNVTKKNKYISMQFCVGHLYGSNSSDFLVITEFNGGDLDIIAKANEEDTRLEKEWMKDKEDRKAFYTLFTEHFKPKHSDEIYTLFTKVIN